MLNAVLLWVGLAVPAPVVPAVAPAADGTRVPIDTTFAVRRDGRLELDGVAGTVRIRAWDRAEMQLRTASGRAAVDIRSSGGVVRVGPRGGGHVGDDMEIRVPSTFALGLAGSALTVDIEGVDGAIRVTSANGAITVRAAGGTVRAESLNGAITLEDVRGAVDVSAMNHRITLSRIRGAIDAGTVNGAILLRDVTSTDVTAETVNGAIEFRGAIANAGRYRFSTHNGVITLALPASANATLSVSTLHGRMESYTPLTRQPGGSDDRALYTIGRGGARVELETFNGNIRLIRP